MSKINKYIFLEVIKGSMLIFFIFLSIAWLLQFTRLVSLTNLIQVDIMTIFYLSLFLIPNLITIIMPFVIIFGLIITFIKLHKDREIISIFSLGLNVQSIFRPLVYFGIINLIILIFFNFYLSPNIYKEYKTKEYEIRNKLNFEKIIISNFIKINDGTFLDFKKDKSNFKEVFIKFTENNENIIFAKEADIIQENDKFNFNLIEGFKITLLKNNKIEKLEFKNYNLSITNNSFKEYNNFDKNTLNIFDDIENKNYINIFYKTTDSIIIILIIFFFYFNNIKKYNFKLNNILFYTISSSILLIVNQILKNSELNITFYFLILIMILVIIFSYIYMEKRYVQN